MGAGKALSEFQKGAIQALMALPKDQQPSRRQMAKQVKCSPKAISNYLKDPVNYGKQPWAAPRSCPTEKHVSSAARQRPAT